ncbi:hypothetical protein I6H88_10085 [Elizabethkingia bruuniana]|uniref:Uncharacterized protein n=1 Tax=Elizabethkingia bruuniana TaxID=1756149 RepID=A0A7T7V2X2_9FLAO|nr:hypothetical protein [Elizabethkingia bruuniana]KGO09337.1 hypothetical protein KS04_14940 [Elizabethkingia miricola]AQX87155.1 hypothetical protein AYC65_20075 [Elizabethkingia bruuniana]KUY23890.1 hypothetical protein ATB97_10970 [Elizabethkingia bruuniana]OPB61518.1 hypothetical protein BAY12_13650 [Elizabethkingia bruuniana]QQN60892.1 hypothetical protein I6H88_10085 [Elizabethkingia bruuniana]
MKLQKIGSEIAEINFMPIRPLMYDQLKRLNPQHRIVLEYDEKIDIYNRACQKSTMKIDEIEIGNPLQEIFPLAPIKYGSLLKLFKGKYKQNEGVDFDESANGGEAGVFVATLISYFTGKQSFFRSPLIYKENGKSIISHSKGLLVMGGYGNGKTSVFKAFHDMFNECLLEPIGVKDMNENVQLLRQYKMHFGFTSTTQVNRDYETKSTPAEKEFYWNRQLNYIKYFDDLLAEDKAKYGHNDLMQSILEERYVLKKKTYTTVNYVDNSENKIANTLNALGDRYGDRIYDRIFQMFNILILEGGSLRR